MALLGRFPQVVLGSDVVPVKDIPRLVTGDRHGHPLGYSRPDHVADCAPSQIVEQQPRYPNLRACRIPGLSEIPAPHSIELKYIEAIHRSRSMEALHQRLQFRFQIKGSSFIIFGVARFQTNDAVPKVHLTPGQSQDFRSSPTGEIGEGQNGFQIIRQCVLQSLIRLLLDESLPDVPLLQHRDIRNMGNPRRRAAGRKIKGPLYGRQLPVDGAVRQLL